MYFRCIWRHDQIQHSSTVRSFCLPKIPIRKIGKKETNFRFSHSCWGFTGADWFMFVLRLFPLTELKLSCAISSHIPYHYTTHESPNAISPRQNICAHDVVRMHTAHIVAQIHIEIKHCDNIFSAAAAATAAVVAVHVKIIKCFWCPYFERLTIWKLCRFYSVCSPFTLE